MPRRLLALLFAASVVASAQSQEPLESPKLAQVAKREAAESSEQNRSTNTPNQPTQPPITVVVQQPPANESADAESRQREVEIQDSIRWFTGVLAAIAGLTLIIIAWQAIETRRAVDAANRSIESNETLTKILHRQWLDGGDWKFQDLPSHSADQPPIVTRGTRLSFIVVNKSDRHVLFESAEVCLSTFTGNRNFITVWANGNIPPNDVYDCHTVPVDFTAEDYAYVDDGRGLNVGVVVRLNFTDAFGDKQVSYIGTRGKLQRDSFPQLPFQGSLDGTWRTCRDTYFKDNQGQQ